MWVIASMPPLLAAYAAMYGWPNAADVELKFTIAAWSDSSSAGIAARHMRNVPVRLTLITWFHMSSVHSCVFAARRIPAAFTSTSSPPSRSTVARTPVSTACSSEMSSTAVVRRLPMPSASASSAVPTSPGSSTSTVCTVPASCSRRSTVARPMPEPPPVTMMRRSWNRSMSVPPVRRTLF